LGIQITKSALTRNFHVWSLPAGEVVMDSLRSWISLVLPCYCLWISRSSHLVSQICPQMLFRI